MELSKQQVKVLTEVQGLTIPDEELDNIATRLSTWLTAMEQIEAELGDEMNLVDPIPPVFPREEF
jgi:Asp-tRNA(Asn)/Glu-tRNA(Gln) amidotransferase C subunit